MDSYTKNGLKLLIIAEIVSLISIIFLYGFLFSYNPLDLTIENISNILFIIPFGVIGSIGGLIGLIGAILFFGGRKEFGENHRKFVFYAVIVLVITIVLSGVLVIYNVILGFSSSGLSSFTSVSPEEISDIMKNNNYVITSMFTAPVISVVGGLVWVFGLYQLENKKGRTILFLGYLAGLSTTISSTIFSYLSYNEWVNSSAFQELINSGSINITSYSQILSSYQMMGTSGLIGLIGGLITGILFILALYIPYNRIKTGELVPVIQKSKGINSSGRSRVCPDCNKNIPFDANICPYCGKEFEKLL